MPSSRLQKARVLIVSHDHATAMQVQDALAGEAECVVRASALGIAQNFAFDLVVLADQHSAISELVTLNVRTILLAVPQTAAKAQALATGRQAVVLIGPSTKDALRACVQEQVGAYVEPW